MGQGPPLEGQGVDGTIDLLGRLHGYYFYI